MTKKSNAKTAMGAKGSPSPILLSIKRIETPTVSNNNLNELELIRSVLNMARINYISINNPYSKVPITIKYSKELANITARLSQINNNIDPQIPDRLKRVLWFI